MKESLAVMPGFLRSDARVVASFSSGARKAVSHLRQFFFTRMRVTIQSKSLKCGVRSDAVKIGSPVLGVLLRAFLYD
jgi:hypothetical protein